MCVRPPVCCHTDWQIQSRDMQSYFHRSCCWCACSCPLYPPDHTNTPSSRAPEGKSEACVKPKQSIHPNAKESSLRSTTMTGTKTRCPTRMGMASISKGHTLGLSNLKPGRGQKKNESRSKCQFRDRNHERHVSCGVFCGLAGVILCSCFV